MRRKGKRRLVPAIVFACIALATPAAAAAGVRISGVDFSGYPELRLTVVAPIGAAQPRLRENGHRVSGLDAANLGNAKSVVLAVDRSESMRGQSLRDALAAAKRFVAAKGNADQIEVVAFGRYALGLTKFSSSDVDAVAALNGIGADSHPGTALYDAIVRSAHALKKQDQPGHVIVVVTDGRDVSSAATLERAVAAAQRAHASVYAIGIAGHDFTPDALRQLAEQTGGKYLEASSSTQLSTLYARISDTLARTWQLRYATAARPGDTLKLTALVPGEGKSDRSVRVSQLGLTRAPAAPQPALLPRSVWRSNLGPAVVVLAVGFLILLAAWFANAARSGSWLSARLAPHLAPAQRRGQVKRHRQSQSLRRAIVAATEQAFVNVKQFRAVQQLLTRADLPLLASELLYICVGSAFVVGMLMAVLAIPPLVVLLFMVGAGAVPLMWVGYLARKRQKAFDNQLPDLLITIAASLKAGHSFRHAIQAVVEEGAEPAAKEFRRVLNETRLGRPMDDALAEMGERVASKNLSFVLTTVTIQRQIGGALAQLFDMVAETVRQRQQFSRKIRSLTAMGRMSAYVLAGLPISMAMLLTVISPTYMAPLWHSSAGHLLIGVALAMLAVGSLILRKIVSFKG